MSYAARYVETVKVVAIVFCKVGEGYECKKYQWGIKYNDHYINKFCNDMKRKFPEAEKVNFYNKKTRKFLECIHLE